MNKKLFYAVYPFLVLCLSGCQTVKMVKVEGKPPVREVYAAGLSFDGVSGEIKYILSEPALVRVNVGIRDGGPLLRTLLDWEYRSVGEHVEIWDKQDASGKVSFGNRTNLLLVIKAIAPDSVPWSRDFPEGFRHAPELILSFPASPETREGLPAVKGSVPVRLTLGEESRVWLAANKYELGLYIDNVFLIEEEEGTNPFTYSLDTTRLNNGPHIITVNLTAYRGDTATVSAAVYVNNE